ncbi:NUDIX hydrolase [Planomicrobium sp. CPCC 101079]|uniref:NUDIX hydrolase n=1 Tax=Planomicrobium sp. CPCC 101079 TaxID=2599618 RepID=UPI0011B4FEB1|nr:NUDIX domain-containing protein [Planomicrobium sp. CPCC 101079]TWT01521.1 NUDIX domain-containing protein [Planomicrobium sp. CPCC 101079]
MYFEKLLSSEEKTEGVGKTVHRTAARAVITRNGKILLVRSARGTYGLPGGGVEEGESYAEALLREVAEETGYINCEVKNKIGVVTERRKDRFEENTYFQMVSHYYLCDLLDDSKASQQPEDYEWEPGTAAVWVEPDQAIRENRVALEQDEGQVFIRRENFVLAEVLCNFDNLRKMKAEI